MRKVNLAQVPVEENPPSPAGRFQSFSQNISQALGHTKGSDSKQNSHAFDLELCRVPPGVSPLPVPRPFWPIRALPDFVRIR